MNSIVSQVKTLGRYNAIAADPELGPYVRSLAPLLANISNKPRSRTRKLGQGSFGRVNLETLNMRGPANNGPRPANVATKYFLTPEDEDDYDFIGEIAALRYLRGLPNVAQLVGVAPPKEGQPHPAVILEKAKFDLWHAPADYYNSWDAVYSAIVQVLQGFYILHQRGLAHRDIKTPNILMTDYGEFQISDFGRSKYLTPGWENDRYRGTAIFASPEMLMMGASRLIPADNNVDWFAHDCWAIGAVLYHIVTGRLFVSTAAETIREVLLHIAYKIGTPTADDGDIYRLYQEFTRLVGPLEIRPKMSIKPLIIDRARQKPADPAILDAVASIIEGFLTYDPKRRLTLQAALQSPVLGGGRFIPVLDIPKPPLGGYEFAQPSAINMINYKKLTDGLYSFERQAYRPNKTNHMITLDRTCSYIFHIVNAAQLRARHLTSLASFKKVGILALYIAAGLFGNRPYEMRDIFYVADRAYSMQELRRDLNIIMSLDIKFYGKTIYDELLEATDDSVLRFKLGIINIICYQEQYYLKFAGRTDELKGLMMEAARAIEVNPGSIKLPTDSAMFDPFREATRRALEGAPAAAAAPVPSAGPVDVPESEVAGPVAVSGGRRRKTKSRRLHKRRTRKYRH